MPRRLRPYQPSLGGWRASAPVMPSSSSIWCVYFGGRVGGRAGDRAVGRLGGWCVNGLRSIAPYHKTAPKPASARLVRYQYRIVLGWHCTHMRVRLLSYACSAIPEFLETLSPALTDISVVCVCVNVCECVRVFWYWAHLSTRTLAASENA